MPWSCVVINIPFCRFVSYLHCWVTRIEMARANEVFLNEISKITGAGPIVCLIPCQWNKRFVWIRSIPNLNKAQQSETRLRYLWEVRNGRHPNLLSNQLYTSTLYTLAGKADPLVKPGLMGRLSLDWDYILRDLLDTFERYSNNRQYNLAKTILFPNRNSNK